MRHLNVFVFCISLFCFSNSYSQDTKVDTVKIGAFISSLHNFDIGNNSINADIHLWFLYNNSNYNFEKEIEFINCDEFSFNGTSIEALENQHWFYTKALIKSRQNFSTRSYPFDSQKLIFSVESSEYTTKDFIFKPDLIGSKLDPNVYVQFEEWNIDTVSFKSSENIYETSFGDPTADSSISPRFDIQVSISRNYSWLILFKLITGIIVAFLISSCVFWIKPNNTDPRFGLCVGGLFAAIGNKYIVESIIPATNELSLLDYLHNITFIFIFLIIIISVISLRLFEQENEKLKRISGRMDVISYWTLTALYFISLSYFIYKFSF